MRWWQILFEVLGGLLLGWLLLAATLLTVRPRGGSLGEAVRLLPDLLRLIGRLAADRSLPRGVRVRLAVLAGYLAMPFDLVPDFIPVLGYADDAIVVAWTLRSVARHAGEDALRRHWPGSEDGYRAVHRLVFAGGRLGLAGASGRASPAGRLGWWADAGLVGAFAGLTLLLANGLLLGLDLAVRDWSDAHRGPAMKLLAKLLNLAGQGTPLTLISLALAGVLAWRLHSVRPLLPVVAAFGLTYLTIGPLKVLLDRAPPHRFELAHPEELFSGGLSYPSGHVVNTIVWYGVLALLLGRWLPGAARTALRVVPPAVVFCSTTYLGYHWLTDGVAGLLLGLELNLVLRRVRWDRLPLGRRLDRSGWAGPAVPAGPAGPAGRDRLAGRTTPAPGRVPR